MDGYKYNLIFSTEMFFPMKLHFYILLLKRLNMAWNKRVKKRNLSLA